MKSELKVDVDAREYPILKRIKDDNQDFVVLFTEKKTGFVVHINKSSVHKIGSHSSAWYEDIFRPLPLGSSVVLAQ